MRSSLRALISFSACASGRKLLSGSLPRNCTTESRSLMLLRNWLNALGAFRAEHRLVFLRVIDVEVALVLGVARRIDRATRPMFLKLELFLRKQ